MTSFKRKFQTSSQQMGKRNPLAEDLAKETSTSSGITDEPPRYTSPLPPVQRAPVSSSQKPASTPSLPPVQRAPVSSLQKPASTPALPPVTRAPVSSAKKPAAQDKVFLNYSASESEM